MGEPGSRVYGYYSFHADNAVLIPFFTCEVKYSAAALNIADRQNAQSMNVALRALVVLFRLEKREEGLDRG